jgi:hypothetical protein
VREVVAWISEPGIFLCSLFLGTVALFIATTTSWGQPDAGACRAFDGANWIREGRMHYPAPRAGLDSRQGNGAASTTSDARPGAD